MIDLGSTNGTFVDGELATPSHGTDVDAAGAGHLEWMLPPRAMRR